MAGWHPRIVTNCRITHQQQTPAKHPTFQGILQSWTWSQNGRTDTVPRGSEQQFHCKVLHCQLCKHRYFPLKKAHQSQGNQGLCRATQPWRGKWYLFSKTDISRLRKWWGGNQRLLTKALVLIMKIGQQQHCWRHFPAITPCPHPHIAQISLGSRRFQQADRRRAGSCSTHSTTLGPSTLRMAALARVFIIQALWKILHDTKEDVGTWELCF